jgi:very-short-patch-repair endonuclease
MAYTLKDIEKILEEDGRGIKIVGDTFVNTSTNATFIHPEHGEWVSTPKRVALKKTTHPAEANQRRKQSNIKIRKENPSILEKTNRTNIKKYGTKWTSQAESVKLKIADTNIKKYGSRSSLADEKIRRKAAKTKEKRYGDANYNNREKAKETCLDKYGKSNPTQNSNIKDKILKTKENKGLIVRPRGLSWEELAKQLNVPRTSLQSFWNENGKDDLSIETFIKLYGENYSDIEMIASESLGLEKFNGGVNLNNRTYRPDFKLNEKIYVNVDGLYLHSQKVNSDNNYHFDMRKSFEEAGFRILQFRSNEIKNNINIVKSIINNTIEKTERKIYARKCEVHMIEPTLAREFLKNNHMMGPCSSRFIGLMHGGKLVSLMGFKIKKGIADIDRFASLVDCSVVGGLSKLIKHLCKTEKFTQINYWVDLRYGTGRSLEKIGFTHSHDILSWQWTDFKNTYHRLKCRANMDNRGLSGAEYAEELKLSKIFDAGQRLYIKI